MIRILDSSEQDTRASTLMRALPVKCQLKVIVLSIVLPFLTSFLFSMQSYDVGTSDGSAQGCLVGSMSYDSITTYVLFCSTTNIQNMKTIPWQSRGAVLCIVIQSEFQDRRDMVACLSRDL